MADALPPPHPPVPGAPAVLPTAEVTSRMQAHLEDPVSEQPSFERRPRRSRSKGPVPTDTGARDSQQSAQRQIDDLNQQLRLLRHQLDVAFDEIDERLEVAEIRASVAEARASAAEALASASERHATDANAQSNLALTRLDALSPRPDLA